MAAGLRRYRTFILVAVVWVLGFLYWQQHSSYSFASSPAPYIPDENVWTRRQRGYPPKEIKPLPSGRDGIRIPKIQAKEPAEDPAAKQLRLSRLAAVRESFKHSWSGYAQNAWMHDEVTPVGGKYRDPFGGWAATLVDALDTLWVMGLKDEFEKAVEATEKIDFTKSSSPVINVFETTIRYLGGFLGAYELSGTKYPLLLAKAVEVGDLLLCAFDTPNGMPIARWEWQTYAKGSKQVAQDAVLVSEIGSLSLEFTKLSQLTGEMKYWDAVRRVSEYFELAQQRTRLPGMWPVIVDAEKPSFTEGMDFTLGGMSDSVYEYLPKQYLILGGQLDSPKKMYENFIEVAKRHMFWKTVTPWRSPIVFSGDTKALNSPGGNPNLKPKYQSQHLTCFVGGMVGLASRIFDRPGELELASELTEGCVWAYNTTQSGLGPEIFSFVPCRSFVGGDVTDDCQWVGGRWYKEVEDLHQAELNPPLPPPDQRENWKKETVQELVERLKLPRGMTNVDDGRYILRPEAIESVFVMYRLTGNPTWMDKAWNMFESIEKHTRTSIASSAVDNVLKQQPEQTDSMESFWLGETLKYFYLIFSEFDVVSLDKWVLNTEAHPLRRPDV